MLIYTHTITSRIRYIMNLLFAEMMGITPELTNNKNRFIESPLPKLVYNQQPVSGALFIESTALLFEEGVKPIAPECINYKDYKALFPGKGDLPFDIFAASFFLVTRYEEYLPSAKDTYGRFQAKNAVAYKQDFLSLPIIDFWVEDLKQLLIQRYPGITFKRNAFRATMTFDIDVAFAFKGRNILTNILSAGKDLLTFRLRHLKERIRVLSGKKADPFDSYDYIRSSLQNSDVYHLFFFLLKRKRTSFDRNISPRSPALGELLRSITSFSKAGIHPSYFSSEQVEYLKAEKQELEKQLCSPVTFSRQHYLRWQLPGTFTALADAGITDDYSMGFAELPGFRAGTCRPFHFYNLQDEVQTPLVLHPISYMDGSLIEDMSLSPEQSIEQIKKIFAAVKKVNGHFISIWHNHTLSDYGIYKGWRKPYEETLRLLKEN